MNEKDSDGMGLIMSVGIDPEVLKIINPTPWQKFMRVVNRFVNHVLYRLRIKKY